MNPRGLLSPSRPARTESVIRIPLLGMSVRIRTPPSAGGTPAIVELLYATGGGMPLWRRAEGEIVQIVTGRYLFEVDGERFLARRGDVVCVPGGAVRACVNVTGTGARQQVVVHPCLDATAFFSELAHVFAHNGDVLPDDMAADALKAFGERWQIQFLGTPLAPDARGPQGTPVAAAILDPF
ncbi:hypothetical protein [Variovorax sp.]|uniref:cupin domain-containing protein n=1 Tax=Variovorax sp. TaxID=1871043 RepID=UPI002D595403|nr:hypothetical protein [Variovorax sp.]HYP85307.1 hypothetical protein [Variovorax sp.]